MIELRNRQYMTIIDCLAGEDLEVGHVITLDYFLAADPIQLRALKATATGSVNAITGPLLAWWINDRSTAVAYTGGEDGISSPTVLGSSDSDANHYIPSGSRMLAIGGRGVAEVRLFADSLDSEFATTMPDAGDTLDFSTDESMLCSTGNGSAAGGTYAFVLENDGVSIAVLLG